MKILQDISTSETEVAALTRSEAEFMSESLEMIAAAEFAPVITLCNLRVIRPVRYVRLPGPYPSLVLITFP